MTHHKAIFAIITAVALLLVVGLYALPMSVVKNKRSSDKSIMPAPMRNMAMDTSDNVPESMPDEGSLAMAGHKNQFGLLDSLNLLRFRNFYNNSTNSGKKLIFADSLATLYRKYHWYDSAVKFTEAACLLQPSQENLVKAGDRNWEAYSVSTGPLRKKYFKQARSYYRQAMGKDSSYLEGTKRLAFTYMMSNQPMTGVRMFKKVLEKDSTDQEVLFELGVFSNQSAQYDKAVERFEQLLTLNPVHTEAMFHLGVSYFYLGKKKQAYQMLQRAKEIDPDPEFQGRVNSIIESLK